MKPQEEYPYEGGLEIVEVDQESDIAEKTREYIITTWNEPDLWDDELGDINPNKELN